MFKIIRTYYVGSCAKQILDKIKLATLVEGYTKSPFSIVTTLQCSGGSATPLSRMLHFTLYPSFRMLNVKQGGIKYHFLSL